MWLETCQMLFLLKAYDGFFEYHDASRRHSVMFKLLRPESLRKLAQVRQFGRRDNYKLLFGLVLLEQWFRSVCSNRTPSVNAKSAIA